MAYSHHSAALLLGGYLILTVVGGCTTVRTTKVDRCLEGCGWTKKCFQGLPITVRVPTSIRVTITETRYLDVSTGKLIAQDMNYWDGKDGTKQLVTNDVAYDIIETAETFFVDTVRPAAGTLDYSATIDAETQYFKKVGSEINDTTLKTITAAVGSLIDNLPKPPKTGMKTGANGEGLLEWTPMTSQVAVKVFAIKSPNIETEIHDFLYEHITNCHPPCPTPNRSGSSRSYAPLATNTQGS